MKYKLVLRLNSKTNEFDVEFDELQSDVVKQFLGNNGLMTLSGSNGWVVAYTLRKVIEKLPDATYTSAYTSDPYVRVKTKLLKLLSNIYKEPDGILQCYVG